MSLDNSSEGYKLENTAAFNIYSDLDFTDINEIEYMFIKQRFKEMQMVKAIGELTTMFQVGIIQKKAKECLWAGEMKDR